MSSLAAFPTNIPTEGNTNIKKTAVIAEATADRTASDAQQQMYSNAIDAAFALLQLNANENSTSELELGGLESLVIATVDDADDEDVILAAQSNPKTISAKDVKKSPSGGVYMQNGHVGTDYYFQSCNSSGTNSNPMNHYFTTATSSPLFEGSETYSAGETDANTMDLNSTTASHHIFAAADNSVSRHTLNVNISGTKADAPTFASTAVPMKPFEVPYVFPTGIPHASPNMVPPDYTVASQQQQQQQTSIIGNDSGISAHTVSYSTSPITAATPSYGVVSQNSPATSIHNSTQSPAPQNGNTMHDDAVRSNLFICGLAPEVGDDEIFKLFAPYGAIESAKVMLDIHTGLSRCIAFVKFKDVTCAEHAIEELNGASFYKHQITVRVANSRAAYLPGTPTNKTFVRNVPLNVSKADLYKYFSQFGEVTDVSVHADTAQARNASNNASVNGVTAHCDGGNASLLKLNIVFVTFSTKEAAAKAAEETHTKCPFVQCNGVPLLAKVAEDNTRRVERLARRFRPNTNNNSSNSANNSGGSGPNSPPPGGALSQSHMVVDRMGNQTRRGGANNNARRNGGTDSSQQIGGYPPMELPQQPFLVAALPASGATPGAHPAFLAPTTAAPFMVMTHSGGMQMVYAPVGAALASLQPQPQQPQQRFGISNGANSRAGQYFLVMNGQQ